MIRSNKSFVVLLVGALGVWGCAKSGAGDAAHDGARVRVLEAKITKLEEDVKLMQTARDHLRLKLDTTEKERTQANRLAYSLTNERNDLKAQLTARTSERDLAQGQFETFRKEIRNLLGQADAAASPSPGNPVTQVTTPPPTPGKS